MNVRVLEFASFGFALTLLGCVLPGCETMGTSGMPTVGLGADCGMAAGTQCELGLSCLNRVCWKECTTGDDCAAFESVPVCATTPEFARLTKVCLEPSGGGAGGDGGGKP